MSDVFDAIAVLFAVFFVVPWLVSLPIWLVVLPIMLFDKEAGTP